MKKILITGIAGFIGFHVAKKLIKKNYKIIGIDNLNNYYDNKLKKDRLKILKKKINFHKIDITNTSSINSIFKKYKPDIVIHLAAQAGVRYSLINPKSYINTNLVGFFNVIESAKNYNIKHFVYASSSSVYGLENKLPFVESFNLNKPANIYGATKLSNELIAHSYSHLFNLPTTGLRYFTVYGPWGRPDMALFKFTKSIINNNEITIYNKGKMSRDFTYIDDAVNFTIKLIDMIPKKKIPHEVYNLGNNKPINLMMFLKILEKCLNKKAKFKILNNQKTEIKNTKSSTKKLYSKIKFKKIISTKIGIRKFIEWYKKYYSVS